jgi:hypothetical protein
MLVMAVQLSVLGLYLPPSLKLMKSPVPPQTIISLPVQTAVCKSRGEGASATSVAAQLSVAGSYLPPVFSMEEKTS